MENYKIRINKQSNVIVDFDLGGIVLVCHLKEYLTELLNEDYSNSVVIVENTTLEDGDQIAHLPNTSPIIIRRKKK